MMNILNKFPNTDRLVTGNFNEKDFWFYSACSVQVGLRRKKLTVRGNSLNSLNLNICLIFQVYSSRGTSHATEPGPSTHCFERTALSICFAAGGNQWCRAAVPCCVRS